ncbi:MAG: polyprenol monophosphomannose synthase [Candidatus Dormibacter sp.]|uniref:polyprenol monophosphomannose synthase n=1 Tax=Candidatus Dormibacter sp. TaxID=2973982 RepID=UPI00267DB10A
MGSPVVAGLRTLVVMPTYNELPNLARVVASIRAQGFQVLVVDDSSPDGTGELADQLAAVDPGVAVLHRAGKLGLGSAYVEGFRRGLALDHDLLAGMDADGSHPASVLSALVEAAASAGGLAIGSRYVRGGAIAGWNRRRRFLSHSANLYCRRILGVQVRDSTSGFRCYPRELLERIDLDKVVSDGYAFLIEMVYRSLRLGYPVVEIPIRFEDRLAGRSKVSTAEIRKAIALVPRLRWEQMTGSGPQPAKAPPEPTEPATRQGPVARE